MIVDFFEFGCSIPETQRVIWGILLPLLQLVYNIILEVLGVPQKLYLNDLGTWSTQSSLQTVFHLPEQRRFGIESDHDEWETTTLLVQLQDTCHLTGSLVITVTVLVYF